MRTRSIFLRLENFLLSMEAPPIDNALKMIEQFINQLRLNSNTSITINNLIINQSNSNAGPLITSFVSGSNNNSSSSSTVMCNCEKQGKPNEPGQASPNQKK